MIGHLPWDSFESKYLAFWEDDHYEGKTKRIAVMSKSGSATLGEIRWWGPWRQYVFAPERDTVFNRECMRDIHEVIDRLMDEWRHDRRDHGNLALMQQDDAIDAIRDTYGP